MMTPETLVIDRQFRGVGRIKKRSGTTNPAMRRKLNRMLTALHDEGRIDILRAIRDGALDLLNVYDAYMRHRLQDLPLAETAQPLAQAFASWRDSLMVPTDYSDDHVRSMGTTVRYLTEADPHALVAHAPRVLADLKLTLGSKHPRSFNITRSHVMAFVRATLGRSHPLWLAVAAVEPKRRIVRRKGPQFSPTELAAIFPAPWADQTDAIAWAMAMTGMGAKELWGRWDVRSDRIHIDGTKRAGRRRDVPLVQAIARPECHRRTFENHVRTRTTALTPYHLRRLFAQWMEAAGIPRTRRRLYMGHGVRDVTDLYEAHEVTKYLADDAARLKAYLGAVLNSPRLRLEASA